jgi:hypothetical protein
VVRKSNREGEFDKSILYKYMETSQWYPFIQLIYTINPPSGSSCSCDCRVLGFVSDVDKEEQKLRYRTIGLQNVNPGKCYSDSDHEPSWSVFSFCQKNQGMNAMAGLPVRLTSASTLEAHNSLIYWVRQAESIFINN